MMLDHNDRLAVFFIQFFQHFVDPVRVGRIQLGDGFVQDQDVRT